jgi:hypothetical protein
MYLKMKTTIGANHAILAQGLGGEVGWGTM